MKKQLFITTLLLSMILPIWSQPHLSDIKGSLGLQSNLYWQKMYFSTDGFRSRIETLSHLQYGMNGEKYLGERLGLHAHFLYEQREFTDEWASGYRYAFSQKPYRIIDYHLHLGEFGISIRFYAQEKKSRIRAYLEAGLASTFILSGTADQKPHPISLGFNIQEEQRIYRMNYRNTTVIANAGLQYRLTNRWGVELSANSRLYFSNPPWSNMPFGINAGINHYLRN